MKDSTTLSHLPAVSDTPSRLPAESVSDSVADTVVKPTAKRVAKPLLSTYKLSLSHEAKMGLIITLIVLVGVVIWVVIELSLYQHKIL